MSLSIQTRNAVLRCLYEIQRKHNRTWSYVKRSTIRNYVKKYSRLNISIHSISYHLSVFYREDFVRFATRYRRDDNGTCHNLPSNRWLTGKSISYLQSLGLKIAKWLIDWAFLGKKPPRFTAKTTPKDPPNVYTRPLRRSVGSPVALGSILTDTISNFKDIA